MNEYFLKNIFKMMQPTLTICINIRIKGVLFYMNGSPHGGSHIEIT